MGKRCGTPIGECGKEETECACETIVGEPSDLPLGMSAEEFLEAWNTEDGRILLMDEYGFTWEDIESDDSGEE